MRKTGWDPPPLMQDDNPQLSRWFASRPDARYVFKRNQRREKMTAITKTQMVNACVDYEVDWFFDRERLRNRGKCIDTSNCMGLKGSRMYLTTTCSPLVY
jgi:hypothetical protein